MMNRRRLLLLAVTAGLAVAVSAGVTFAQEKQQVSFKTPAENTKYADQHAIDVGDVPGHQVRVFQLHRSYPTNAPVIDGVKLKESLSSNTSDYTDGNGQGVFYSVYTLDNGDKFFSRGVIATQRLGDGKLSSLTAGTITGGTGKFLGMQGIVRGSTVADPKAGINEQQAEIEYWFRK